MPEMASICRITRKHQKPQVDLNTKKLSGEGIFTTVSWPGEMQGTISASGEFSSLCPVGNYVLK